MTLQKDQDPGFWRRGMTKRGFTIAVVVAAAIVVGGIVFVIATGIPLF
jgi:hypothetical protein